MITSCTSLNRLWIFLWCSLAQKYDDDDDDDDDDDEGGYVFTLNAKKIFISTHIIPLTLYAVTLALLFALHLVLTLFNDDNDD